MAHKEAWCSIIVKRPSTKIIIQNACEDKAHDSVPLRKFLENRKYIVHIPKRGLDTIAIPKNKKKQQNAG